jgi:hypothetical protein
MFMTPREPEAGKRRADAIHEQIDKLKSGQPSRPPQGESEGAFVQRRMRELAAKEKQPKSPPAKKRKN